MKKKPPFFAFIALFLGWFTYKNFNFETFKFDTPVAWVYLITSLVAGYFYFNPLKNENLALIS